MNWAPQRLADHCEKITKGTTPTSLGMSFTKSGIPFVRVQNLVDGTVRFEKDDLFIDYKTHESMKRSKIYSGDVLLSIAGTIGRCAIVPEHLEELNCNQAVAIIRPRKSVDRRFLMHWISSRAATDQIQQSKVTATISNLSLGQIGELRIPLPPLAEQKRIAAILDQAGDLRRKRQRALGCLSKLGNAIFSQMFEAELRSPNRTALGEIVEEFRYGTSNKASQSAGYPTLRIPNVVGGNIDATDLKSVPLSDAEFRRLKLVDGDVLFVRTNGNPDYVGRSAVFTLARANAFGTEATEWAYASYLIRARPKRETLNPWFLQAYLSHPQGKKALKERSKTSAGQFNINTEGLGSIPIPIVPVERQIEFETAMAGLSPIKLSLLIAEKHSGSLFDSLQHRAFRGEL